MKRIIAVTFSFLMMFSISALSEATDLSSMNLDELIELREEIDDEIRNRTDFFDQQIGTGQYIVGEDIKAGKYEFVCTFVNIQESLSGGAGHNLSRIAVWTESSEDGEKLLDVGQILVDQQFMVDLEDSNVLLIKGANFAVRPYSPDWKP